ncbi:hypothetical protein AMD27_11945 [Acinetobacter sp. TGL-Y2]|uniref:poly-beta-1,6-N-acetyl-D-glucosamine biosynthesis protein PgaD n=1 Tax=Acinetobacter sp. TGL-Y2 TaxID=1407071 RepID=UPI0007A658D7|nr:poly-beta-1,6-N-acetyl-D-glucosamine biosynthesis protein PgaD [Acinetobacter sp. TGL-Y2]AMW79529.1 hypothetical protein AMD27_11945 [Acinetobacter sp. TGL-Y2]
MNIQSIIIDIRHQLPWQKRYLTNTSTFMLWGAWLLLWEPLMMCLGILDQHHDHDLVDQILRVFFRVLENGFIAILACALMLWLWSNFIPATSVKYAQVKGIQDYASHFNLPAEQIHGSRVKKVVTVHHNASGQIVKIE